MLAIVPKCQSYRDVSYLLFQGTAGIDIYYPKMQKLKRSQFFQM